MRCYIVKITIIKSFNKLRFAFDLIVIISKNWLLEHNLESALCTLLKLILIFSYSFMFIKFHTITSKNKSKICF